MATTFKDKTWDERVTQLGDQAEAAFERWAKTSVRMGFNRPDLDMSKIPSHVNYMPDYLYEHHSKPVWVEVQGCGKDQFFKFKEDKLTALQRWQQFSEMPVYLWLWDMTNDRQFLVPLTELVKMTFTPRRFQMERDTFPEGKPFVKFPVETFLAAGYVV